MKPLIQFHTGMSVSVERTACHSIFRHLDPVIFSCLPCRYSVFDCFKYVHFISLPFIYRQSLKGKKYFSLHLTQRGGGILQGELKFLNYFFTIQESNMILAFVTQIFFPSLIREEDGRFTNEKNNFFKIYIELQE